MKSYDRASRLRYVMEFDAITLWKGDRMVCCFCSSHNWSLFFEDRNERDVTANGDPKCKERFAIPRYSLIIIQKLWHEPLSTISHSLLWHYKAFVVPWHQLVYILFIPCGFRQHSPGLQHMRSIYQQGDPSFSETGRSATIPGPACTEDARRCPNGIARAARLVSAGQYVDVHWRAVRACLLGKIT